MFPLESWTGPDPAQCSLRRLGGGGVLITDTCNTARKSRQLLAELIARQVEEHLGTEKWGAMTEQERESAVRTHNVDCWQHLRNIFLAEMSSAQVSKCHMYSHRCAGPSTRLFSHLWPSSL